MTPIIGKKAVIFQLYVVPCRGCSTALVTVDSLNCRLTFRFVGKRTHRRLWTAASLDGKPCVVIDSIPVDDVRFFFVLITS